MVNYAAQEIIVINDNQSVKFIDINDGTLIRTIINQDSPILKFLFAPDNYKIAIIGKSSVNIYFTHNGKLLTNIKLHESDNILNICFSSDNNLFSIIISSENTVICNLSNQSLFSFPRSEEVNILNDDEWHLKLKNSYNNLNNYIAKFKGSDGTKFKGSDGICLKHNYFS